MTPLLSPFFMHSLLSRQRKIIFWSHKQTYTRERERDSERILHPAQDAIFSSVNFQDLGRYFNGRGFLWKLKLERFKLTALLAMLCFYVYFQLYVCYCLRLFRFLKLFLNFHLNLVLCTNSVKLLLYCSFFCWLFQLINSVKIKKLTQIHTNCRN